MSEKPSRVNACLQLVFPSHLLVRRVACSGIVLFCAFPLFGIDVFKLIYAYIQYTVVYVYRFGLIILRSTSSCI